MVNVDIPYMDPMGVFQNQIVDKKLGGGFKYFLFLPLFGEDFPFD